MYLLAFLPYVLQLLLIIHIIKTGRPFVWLWLVVFLPYIGGIAYLLVEVLPEFMRNGSAKKVGSAVSNAVHPGRQLTELEQLVQRQGTVANKTQLADAYMQHGRYAEALALYDSCLSGPYQNDEVLSVKRIQALYSAGRVSEAQAAMAEFKQRAPLSSAEQVLLDVQLSGDYDKMKDIFFQTNDFRVGYLCAEHFHTQGQDKEVAAIIAEMEENLRLYKYLRKTESNSWYKKTKALAANRP